MINSVVLIPAYNPDARLERVVSALVSAAFTGVVVVNDGSKSACAAVFDAVARLPGCVVLAHPENRGKGEALKTGLRYIHNGFPDVVGVVTADADGQHQPEDIIRIGQSLEQHPRHLVMGSRELQRGMPLRSAVGNRITRSVFSALSGRRVHDTQSGLRGIQRESITRLLDVSGSRYEYEMAVLLASRQLGLNVHEEPVATIYLDENRSSHFRPLLDSMSIYAVLARFLISSIVASALDLLLFSVLYLATGRLIEAAVAARAVSSVYYLYTKTGFVFRMERVALLTLAKYYAFVCVMGSLVVALVAWSSTYAGDNVLVTRLTVECLLFWVSFVVQRDFIFVPAGRTAAERAA